ncbi:MerR family transcriptional regulator [Paenibacillus sp. 2TAB23]|uniref:MerR family transcriptional regulator n=1 Tax=Paenibacillus sp. 2TAB23 TaxID=3233004 RepID=UPI003F9B8B60
MSKDRDNQSYTISEVSEMTGLSSDTLRYYEKIGLVTSPERGAGKKRLYTNADIGRIRFLTYLKRTNMPLKKIQQYVESYDHHDEAHCYELLDEHRQEIERQMRELEATKQIIQFKLAHFQEIKDGKLKEGYE